MIGGYLLGEEEFGEEYSVSKVADSPNSGTYRKTQAGWGQLARRGYNRSFAYELNRTTTESPGLAALTITTASGALVGTIRTDVERSIVESLEFTDDDRGNADFILKLNKLPSFPVLPFSIIQITIGNDTEPWYAGEISYKDDIGTKKDIYEYRGYGLRNYLSGLKANTTYTAGMDVGQVVEEIAQNWIEPYAPISFNSSKIETSTGVPLAGDIEIGKYSLDKVLDNLADMANAQWGVDGSKELYFELNSTDIVKTHFLGYDMTSFEPKENLREVKNAITVQRKKGASEGGAGWAVAGVYNDASSVKKYGRKELNYQIPGYYSDDDADVIGNNLLSEKAEPKISAQAKGFHIVDENDKIDRGVHRFINTLDDFNEVINDVDNADEWTIVASTGSDLAKSLDTTSFVHGSGALKLTWTDAFDDYAEIDFPVNGKGLIKKIRMYIKGSKTGNYLTAGVGLTNWDENTVKVPIPTSEQFIPFEWDISSLGLTNLGKFGIRIDEGIVVSSNVLIDKLEVEFTGHKYYKLERKRVTYKFEPNGQTADAEFGELPPRMSDFVSALISTATELNFTSEAV